MLCSIERILQIFFYVWKAFYGLVASVAWMLFSWASADREYEARLERYSERIWTCKSTGSSQLTHKEAWEEEQEVAEL